MATALGIDISDDALRIVELRASGNNYTVLQIVQAALPDDRSPDAIAEVLAPFAGNTRQVAVAVPASGCIFKTALLPPAKPADLERVVRFEAETQFPLALEELTWGYKLTPTADGRMHAAIVGAHRNLVDERLALLQQLGMTPAAILVAPLAAAQTMAHPDGEHILVMAGDTWTDICLYNAESLQGCRSILAGSPTSEGWAERLVREIRPWTAHTAISQVIVSGSVPRSSVDALGRSLGIMTTHTDPFSSIDNAGKCLSDVDAESADFVTALGLAITALQRKPEINLLPAQVTAARAQRRKLGMLTAGLTLAAILLALLSLTNHDKLGELRGQLLVMQSKTKQSGKPPVLTGNLVAARQVVDAGERAENNPLELLRILSEKMPEGVILSNLTFDRGRTLVLKGRVPSNDALTATLESVTGMTVFARAMLDYSHQVKDGQGYDFQITCPLPPSNDPTSAQARGKTKSQSKTETTDIQ